MGIDTSRGFVAFPRGLTTWEWYDDPNTCRLFFHLMLTVNWEPKSWHGILVEAGSRVASIQVLAAETGLTVRNVRTALERLKSTGYLTIKSTNKYSVLSLNHWKQITGLDKLSGKQPTGKRQANDNQPTTTKPLEPFKPFKPAATAAPGEAPSGDLLQPPLPPLLEENWKELGLGKRMGPAVQQALQSYLAAGLEARLVLQAMQETAEHDAHAPLPYLRSILDRCQAQGIRTLDAWQAGRRPSGSDKRVDRPEPSGNDFLADALTRPRRHKRKE